MVTKIYPVVVELLLTPVGRPKSRISLGDYHKELTIDNPQWEKIVYQGCGSNRLTVEHYDKSDNDPTTALIISEVKFNDISNPKFVYQGNYYPLYPKHLSGSTTFLPHQNYLGWNGVWQLDFTLPIYTWIHKTLDLGWIYD
jgi:hypothetical protein